MLKKYCLLLLPLFLAATVTSLHAEEHERQSPPSALGLTPPLQEALTQEMISVQNTMMQMMPSIASGNWERVAKLAQQIEGAYIMRQKLSAAQLDELHRKLPAGFIELDHNFHRMAGMLAHVAEEPHVELVSFYYYKLTDSCIACHSKFATIRFPELAHAPATHTSEEDKGTSMQATQHMHNPEHHH